MDWVTVDERRVDDPGQHASLASELIATLPQTTIIDQLAARRIRRVILSKTFMDRINTGCLRTERDGFVIALNRSRGSKTKLITVGHEIAHTYFMFPVAVYGRCYFTKRRLRCGPGAMDVEEAFCEEFARQWMVTLDKQQVLRQLLIERKRVVARARVSLLDPKGLPDDSSRFFSCVIAPDTDAEDLPF